MAHVDLELISAEPSGPAPPRPPLLFVHGLWHAAWCWSESWMPRAAAHGWSAHALSWRAHGASGGGQYRARITVRDYEQDVVEAASRLPRPPVVVAHSFNTATARAATRVPFAAMVLLGPVGISHGLGTLLHNLRRKPAYVARVLAGISLHPSADDLFAGLDPDQAAGYLARLDPEPPLVQYQLAFHGPPGRPAGDAPVLVYGAERDAFVPAGDMERTAAYYGTSVRWLPGMGHDVMLDAGNEQVLDIVLADVEAALA